MAAPWGNLSSAIVVCRNTKNGHYLIGNESTFSFGLDRNPRIAYFKRADRVTPKTAEEFRSEVKRIMFLNNDIFDPILRRAIPNDIIPLHNKQTIQNNLITYDTDVDIHYVLNGSSLQQRIMSENFGAPKGGWKPIDGQIGTTNNLEATARREFMEETFFDITGLPLTYINNTDRFAIFYLEVDDSTANQILFQHFRNERKSELCNLRFTNVDLLISATRPSDLHMNAVSKNAISLVNRFLADRRARIEAERVSRLVARGEEEVSNIVTKGIRRDRKGKGKGKGKGRGFRYGEDFALTDGSSKYHIPDDHEDDREDDSYYVKKYLKYKAKYLALKKKLNL